MSLTLKPGKQKLKSSLTSERTLALLGFIGVTILNSVVPLHLEVPAVPGGVPPLVLIAANVGAFILGKSVRPTDLLKVGLGQRVVDPQQQRVVDPIDVP